MQHEAIIQHIMEPARFEKFAIVAKAANDNVTIELARTIVTYEAQFYGNRLAKIDLGKHQLTVQRGADFFLEVIQCGMSFSPEANHVYLAPDFQNVNRLECIKTADGNIFLAQKAGSISHVTKPVMVYPGEKFMVGTNAEGKQVVIHGAIMQEKKEAIVAGYVFIVYPKGEREPFWMDLSDINRLKAKSKRPALYSAFNGGIDPGFFGTKLINHGLKNVRKVAFYGAPEDAEDFETFDEVMQPTPPAYQQPVQNQAPQPIQQQPVQQQAPPSIQHPVQQQPMPQQPPPFYGPAPNGGVNYMQPPATPQPYQPSQRNGVYAEPF